MAADSDEEKTESATPHRLEKARAEGDIPRSKELTAMLMLASGLGILWTGGEHMAQQLGDMLVDALSFSNLQIRESRPMLIQLDQLTMRAVVAIIPLMIGLILVAIAGSMLLGGMVISAKSLRFDPGKLNPLKGLKRIVSAQTLAELLKSILKAVLTGCVAGWYVWTKWPVILHLISEPPFKALADSLNMLAMCSILVVSGLLPMVGFDIFWQFYSYYKKLRMSRQEIRDEHKNQQGDPQVKGRIRQAMHAAARRRMMADVPKADVIVTNPSHYAVALQYIEGRMSAPKVVAKGAGEIALRIRELGKAHRIPLLEAPPLARALWRHSEIGQQIPGTLYAAVAEVLAWVWQLRRWRHEGGLIPPQPVNLPVPEALDFAREATTDG